MANEPKAPKEKAASDRAVKVEALTRIRTGRTKGENGQPGRAEYVEEGDEFTMALDEAEKAEARGIVKILESKKAREAAK